MNEPDFFRYKPIYTLKEAVPEKKEGEVLSTKWECVRSFHREREVARGHFKRDVVLGVVGQSLRARVRLFQETKRDNGIGECMNRTPY